MTDTAQHILKTMGYFDLFQYPLTREEICLFHAVAVPNAEIESSLEILVRDKAVCRLDEFYSLQYDYLLAERRRKGNQLATGQLITARRVAKFLSAFPYVKGIAVSGSLSKNFATEKTDIDFFIVTAANRLWFARTCMHLYKKMTFLTGKQNWFCMNYFVDEEALEIKEKNIFTAMEIVTLLPMQGGSSLFAFMASNDWTKNFFPLYATNSKVPPEIKKGLVRRLVEKTFNGRLGDSIDKKLMHITRARWQKKVQNHQVNSRGGAMGMIVERHCSKPDPKNFQDTVVKRYRDKVNQLLQPKSKSASLIL